MSVILKAVIILEFSPNLVHFWLKFHLFSAVSAQLIRDGLLCDETSCPTLCIFRSQWCCSAGHWYIVLSKHFLAELYNFSPALNPSMSSGRRVQGSVNVVIFQPSPGLLRGVIFPILKKFPQTRFLKRDALSGRVFSDVLSQLMLESQVPAMPRQVVGDRHAFFALDCRYAGICCTCCLLWF